MGNFKVLVLFRSKHGSTKRYAGWIGDALDADVMDVRSEGWEKQLNNYDMIIYGANLNVGGMSDLPKFRSKITALPDKNVAYFAVGSFLPSEETVTELINSNFPEKLRSSTTLFHFRGCLDYLGLGFWDKFMMRGVQKRILEKKEPLTPVEEEILMAFEQPMDWCDKTTIQPLVDYVKSFMTPEQILEMEEKSAIRQIQTAKREEEEAIAWAEEMKRREALYLERERQEFEQKRKGMSKKQKARYDAYMERKKAAEALEEETLEKEALNLDDDPFLEDEIEESEFSDDYSDFHDDEDAK